MKLRFPKEVLESRMKKFQEKLRENNIDAAMIRTLSSFIYFTGTKWLRPALLVPAEGEPVLFVARGEEEGIKERTWIQDIITFTDGGDLMAKVSSTIRNSNYRVVGLEYGIERDAYIIFYEMFKRLNPKTEVVDISNILYSMRMIKDEYELDAIRKAGKIASKVMSEIIEIIEPGLTETEIAGEAYRLLYKYGSEEPLVYVNVGPHPRVHAEPFSDVKVRRNVFVNIVIGADYNRYYANMARTVYVGEPNGLARKALECMQEIYNVAIEKTKPGTRFISVIKELDNVYKKYNLLQYRVVGYAHSVGLQIEEPPITTILPKDRFVEVKPNMVLAFIHAPLLIEGLGQVKYEDTFIVRKDGVLENITR